jgi:hypothetical protein
MIKFKSSIKKFTNKGEKSGWTYIDIPFDIAEQVNPGIKKSFKVKGKLDSYSFEGINLLPMGEGNFIMALNATVRKELKKQKGDTISIQLELDTRVKKLSNDFISCLEDEPKALEFFKTLPGSHQRYFSNWIETAKTDVTKTKRITQAIIALSMKLGFSEMIRMNQKKIAV